MTTIFISHATADKQIVDDFFDLLQTGCDVRQDDIFCSSVEGAGIRTGEDFVEWIHSNLEECTLIVLFLTPNYYASHFCLAEMGAAWALRKYVFPLVIPDIERDAGVVLIGKQTEVVSESGLDSLRDCVLDHCQYVRQSTPRWTLKRNQFLKNFRDKIRELPMPDFVRQALLEEEQKKTAEAMKMNDELTEEIRKLHRQIKRLEEAKDAEEVAKVKSEFTDDDERYSELVRESKKQLNKLSLVEIRCVFANIRGEFWTPSEYDFREEVKSIERAVQSDSIIENGDDIEGYRYDASADHPRIQKVLKALDHLDKFIENDLSEDKRAELIDDKGHLIDLRNREYWDEELGQSSMPD